MENAEHIQIKKSLVLEKEGMIESQLTKIRELFQVKANLIQKYHGIITKEIDEVSHNINRLFETKSKLEAEVKVLKADILNMVLYA